MALSTMPDLCLLTIFDNLPILDFLSINLVCDRWAILQPAASLRRKTMTLEVTDGALPVDNAAQFHYQESLFKAEHHCQSAKVSLSKINNAIVRRLVSKLPHINSLVVILHFVPSNQIPFITTLLIAYQDNLTCFRFYSIIAIPFAQPFSGSMNCIELPKHLADLLATVNLMPGLSTLTFENGNPIVDRTDAHIELPVMAQLNQLELFTGHKATSFQRALFTVGETSDRLQSISFGNPMDLNSLYSFLRSPNLPESVSKYAHLAVKLNHKVDDQELLMWERFVDLFGPRLTSLEVSLSHQSLPTILDSLTTFQALTTLHLKIEFPTVFRWSINRSEAIDVSLPSIHSLTITTITFAHAQLCNWINFSICFPNITKVTTIVLNRDCFTCGYGSMREIQNPSNDQVEACLKYLVTPLKQCTKLSAIKTVSRISGYTKRWNTNEL